MGHFDADGLIGFVVVEDDGGGGFFGFDDGGGVEAEVEGVGQRVCSLPGYGLVLDLAGGHFFEDNLFERFRGVHALGDVEDFDAGEVVGSVVIKGDAVFEVFRGYGGVCESDV